MTTLIQSPKYKLLVSLYLLYFLGYSFAFEEKETAENFQFHTIQFSSEQPSSSCIPPTKGSEEGTYLKLVHKRGPCSPFFQKGRGNALSVFETVERDKSRIKVIQSRITKSNFTTLRNENDYIVTVALGTPQKKISFSFDTGSFLTWTQCKAHSGHYFRQKHPLFEPSKSKTFTALRCTSPSCPGKASKCRCNYKFSYGDGATTAGYLSQDRLTLTSSDVIGNFLFGCAENNTGPFNELEEDGILGLSLHPYSIVQQTAKKHHQIFSYCIPSKSNVGFLRFGGGVKESLVYIPIKRLKDNPTFYGVDIIGVTVGGNRVPIPSSIFTKVGAIIDSGTTITRFPFEIYKSIRDAYRKAMSRYKLVDPKGVGIDAKLFDTCHSLAHQKSFKVPKVSFLFSGGVAVHIPASGVAQNYNSTILCMAMAGERLSGGGPGITWGNVQQETIEVVYDVGKGRIGFGYGACK